ncbi:histamine H2 receptor-like [Dendronephthya gigantea]|uniref:histamine H2 receptor-like n=1 Tax=Dendronephthya gigantea TaxID=151771 RepID=UPI00106B0FEE|nr:histamine H2 receptor-like [Dendronephthya gigantea]
MSSLNVNGKRCAGVWPNDEISYTNACFSAFLSFITVPGNLLVFVVVLRNPNGKMRTPFNWFILNLGIADLLVGLVVEPLAAVVHIREAFGFPLKYHVYLQPFYFTSCTASVFSLGMLTIDRYIAITSPLQYRATLSNKRALVSSLVIWIISIALPFLQMKIGFLWYFFVFGNAAVLVTFFVLVFAFVRVHLTLRAQIRELSQLQGSTEENRVRNNALKNEEKITRVFLLMLLIFCVCYTPSLLMIYLMNFCTTCSCQSIHWFRDLSFVFVVLNSCMNPFIYALRMPNFRESVRILFKKGRSQTPAVRYQATTSSKGTASTKWTSSEVSAPSSASVKTPPVLTTPSMTSHPTMTSPPRMTSSTNEPGNCPMACNNQGFSENA